MKNFLTILAVLIVGVFVFRACGDSPREASEKVVEGFLSDIKKGNGEDAVKALYTPYKNALEEMVKPPINIGDFSKAVGLAYNLSAMGKDIKKFKIVDTREIDKNHIEVTVKLNSKGGKESLVNFILIKDDKRWKIANISPIR
ncbi:MAG: DUF4878 domain-containing protein [Aquificaceae bacterium]|nr:DUF4878 domain-containing protein [Aquificaceae bacterium]